MIYAVIHESRLVSLHKSEGEAKVAALTSATTNATYVEFVYLYEQGNPHRCEVHYRPARNRAWVHSGVFVESAELSP